MHTPSGTTSSKSSEPQDMVDEQPIHFEPADNQGGSADLDGQFNMLETHATRVFQRIAAVSKSYALYSETLCLFDSIFRKNIVRAHNDVPFSQATGMPVHPEDLYLTGLICLRLAMKQQDHQGKLHKDQSRQDLL